MVPSAFTYTFWVVPAHLMASEPQRLLMRRMSPRFNTPFDAVVESPGLARSPRGSGGVLEPPPPVVPPVATAPPDAEEPPLPVLPPEAVPPPVLEEPPLPLVPPEAVPPPVA